MGDVIIDTGCIQSRPKICPDGRCYVDYSFCQIITGCTTSEKPLMCPSGFCVSNFSDCGTNSYKCAVPSYSLCPDGKCRK